MDSKAALVLWKLFIIAMSFGNSKVKEDNFRILAHLIMCKLLPVTARLCLCFCSKIGKFFIVSFRPAWRKSDNLYCCIIKLGPCVTLGWAEIYQARTSLYFILRTGRTRWLWTENEMILNGKLEVGAKPTNSEHCCKLTIITGGHFTL